LVVDTAPQEIALVAQVDLVVVVVVDTEVKELALQDKGTMGQTLSKMAGTL
jgi:hypothetical protein